MGPKASILLIAASSWLYGTLTQMCKAGDMPHIARELETGYN
jgi:hypothetical protein